MGEDDSSINTEPFNGLFDKKIWIYNKQTTDKIKMNHPVVEILVVNFIAIHAVNNFLIAMDKIQHKHTKTQYNKCERFGHHINDYFLLT